jgi:cytidine deaminase
MDEAKWEALRAAALTAQAHAYAPYSGFAVGAAVLTRSNETFVGCNVENASYGATLCAERNALSSAVAAGERELVALAIVTDATEPTPPCGICRQFLSELGTNLLIRSYAPSGAFEEHGLAELLPHAFQAAKMQ